MGDFFFYVRVGVLLFALIQENKTGFDAVNEEVVSSQTDVATDVVDFCQHQVYDWDAKIRVTGLDTTRRANAWRKESSGFVTIACTESTISSGCDV